MNHSLKTKALAASILLCAVYLRADQTNLVQNLNIRLTGIRQGQTETNREVVRTGTEFVQFNTRDVIKQLGSSTGTTFSDKANLVVVTPLPSGSSAIVVRDESLSVDVTGFFVYEQKSGFVSSSQSNLRTGRGSSIDYSIQRLALTDASFYPALKLHFDVQGIGIETTATSTSGGSRTELDASVSGSGDAQGQLLILEGSFRVQGHLLEVDSAPPPNV